jgi:N-methylhydantoinase A/oxoprolinase/acetone carboxylase beta subunit
VSFARLDVSRSRRCKQGRGAGGSTYRASILDTAAGIVDIVNNNMIGAIRVVSVERGYDPKDSHCFHLAAQARCMVALSRGSLG